MATYINTLKHLFESYKLWVAQNPQVITDFETTAKWVSYFIAGRISKSSISTELIYTLSNLLILFNDKIIEKAHGVHHNAVEKTSSRLKVILTTLEYCEVLLETSARKMYGEKVRWTVIITIQTIKAIGRYLLFFKYSESIIRSPPIKQLNRKSIEQEKPCDLGLGDAQNGLIKLERSGRVMRKVEGAPPLHFRNWQSLQNDEHSKKNSFVLFKAEALYIAKPILHLLSTGIFGTKSWKSYSIALALDVISIRLYYEKRHLLTKEQKLELSRRTCNLLMFLLRSPFYEAVSQRKVNGFIEMFSNRIPFAKTICDPLKEYIPQWQDTYFYTWST